MPWIDAVEVARETPATKKEADEVRELIRRGAKPRFYADENFPESVVAIILHMGGRAITARELHQLGKPDEDHAAYALKHGYVLLTCDRDFLNERRFPLVHSPATVVLDFGNGSADEIVDALRCLRFVFAIPQFYDKWVKIDAKRDTWTEYMRYKNGTTTRTRYREYRGKAQEWRD
jgi:predicted nuclease of predicted toxin-antitoxin system